MLLIQSQKSGYTSRQDDQYANPQQHSGQCECYNVQHSLSAMYSLDQTINVSSFKTNTRNSALNGTIAFHLS